MEGLRSSRSIQRDGWALQDTRCLVRSRSPAEEELVGSIGKGHGRYRPMVTKEALFKALGRGVWLVHPPPGPLPSFSTSSPVHQYGKGPVPVYLGQTCPFSASEDLSASSVQRRLRSIKCGDASSHFASQFPSSDVCTTR